jgi:glutamine kinase
VREAAAARLALADDPRPSVRLFGSKAETLAVLEGRLRRATIPDLVFFSAADWHRDRAALLNAIAVRLRASHLAVRSSARGEDRVGCSLAGRYRSRLDVPNESTALAAAIDEVVASYDGADHDQVLVQEMARAVRASGVVLTRDPETGAPYYVVELHDASARTDVVTSGRGPTKTLWIHHDAPLGTMRSPRLLRLLAAIREIEEECGPRLLEIEFAEGAGGAVSVLQVRAIAARVPAAARAETSRGAIASIARVVARLESPRPGTAGRRTILAQMPDWNPAELIGAFPSPLAASLFRFLISDEVWRRARVEMGYARLPGVPLVRFLLGRPYVDVRASFHSFLPSVLPAGLPADVASALVDAWLDRLDRHPELHDRVELEVAQTAFDLDFFATHRRRHGALLSKAALERWAGGLRCLTNAALAPGGTLERSLDEVEHLARCLPARGPRDPCDPLARALGLLAACRAHGTLPFAVVARHAFLATALLRSAVWRGALSEDRLREFQRSLRTVATELAADLAELSSGRLDRAVFL